MKRLVRYLSIFALAACVEKYDPKLHSEDVDLLVVDGYVNTSAQTAFVKLTLAQGVNEIGVPRPATDAHVALESKDGNSYELANLGDGSYQVLDPSITDPGEFRLHIRRGQDQDVYSEYVSAIGVNSVIDSVYWKTDGDALTFWVDGHDPGGKAQYFLWDLEETWEYHSPFPSYFKVVGHDIVRRQPNDGIGVCWGSARSPNVLIYDASSLNTPIVSKYKLISVPATSFKLSIRYSLLVRQLAISKDAFKYWTTLKNTTESIGGLFDTQLSRVTGNLTSSNGRPVLGYFGSSDIVEQRIFIDHKNLPEAFGDRSEKEICSFIQDLVLIPGSALDGVTEKTLLVEYDSPSGGYYTADPLCIDCRTRGGTLVKPEFW